MNNSVCNSNRKGGLFSRLQLRGEDLNLRPLGYEPNELPLLHPASVVRLFTIRMTGEIVNGAGNYFCSCDESFSAEG